MKCAAFLFAVVFSLYVFSAHSAFPVNDSPEIIASCHTLSPAHPPGYPVFVMLGKAVLSIFPPAFGINCMSAFFFALTGAAIFLIVRKNSGIYSGIIAFFMFCFWYMPWVQALEAKGGIYGLNVLLSVISLFLISSDDRRHKLMAFFVTGLAIANHSMSALFLLPALFLSSLQDKGRVLFQGIIFLLAGATPYIFLIIRSWSNPGIIWGDAGNLAGFLEYVLRLNYRPHSVMTNDILLSNLKQALYVAGPAIIPAAIGFGKALENNRKLTVNLFLFAVLLGGSATFFNATPVNMSFYAGIFLIPVFAALVIMAGLGDFGSGSKAMKLLFLVFSLSSMIYCFIFYSGSVYFTGYDNAMNIAKTAGKNSVLFTNDDSYAMAAYYLVNVKKEGIRHYPAGDLTYEFGIKTFEKNENIKIATGQPDIIRAAYLEVSKKNRVFVAPAGSGRLKRYPEGLLPYGILYAGVFGGPSVFKLYAYRNIINDATDNTLWYPVMMLNTAVLLNDKNEKSQLLNKALAFGHEMNREEIKISAGRNK